MLFADLRRSDMRLVMLRAIAEEGYSLNESMLLDVLGMFGHSCSRDQVRTEMRWLEEQGLVTIDTVAGVLVGHITGRGCDAASGKCRIDGVKKPRPKG